MPNVLPISDGRRTLRPLCVRDAEDYAAGTRDPQVQTFAHLPEPVYTSESVELAARLAARSGLTELTARTLARNVSSQRTLERAGFHLLSQATGETPAGERVPLMHYRRQIS